MVELSVVRDLVAIFGVIAGFTYYVLTVRNAQRNQQQQLDTRQAQLFMQIMGQFNTSSMAESRRFYFDVELSSVDDYLEMLADPETGKVFMLFGGYLEGIGVMVRRKVIDIEMIVDYFGGVTKFFWEKFSPIFFEYRERMNAPRLYSEWEYLYNEIMSYAEKHPELGVQDSEYKID